MDSFAHWGTCVDRGNAEMQDLPQPWSTVDPKESLKFERNAVVVLSCVFRYIELELNKDNICVRDCWCF